MAIVAICKLEFILKNKIIQLVTSEYNNNLNIIMLRSNSVLIYSINFCILGPFYAKVEVHGMRSQLHYWKPVYWSATATPSKLFLFMGTCSYLDS